MLGMRAAVEELRAVIVAASAWPLAGAGA